MGVHLRLRRCGRRRRSSSMLLGERTICVGRRAGPLCLVRASAETKNEMDNRVLFSQEPTNKVVFKHPITGWDEGDETLLFNGDALPFVYLRHEGLINHKELGDVVEYSGLSCESLELNTADVILVNHRVWTRKQWNGRETLWVLIHVLLPLTGGDTDIRQLITRVGRAIVCHSWRVELKVTIILTKVIPGRQIEVRNYGNKRIRLLGQDKQVRVARTQ
jgi:hypothetical protein